ncbi:MAG: acylneuraminate cytidylyltransferase family protein [Marinobacter sp.]|uniref:acylneuraminate cytidylyltransferase family protein n=1 Tax=Marinobacter sp. TaxID=50741 RepID=UPI00299F3746|nr:acylneuraminate cytidylyltransferase family protein [Marinobacter sp.]MDX1754698.1 acylneuraminate cytidylyltransferase family protein [Marinobacter sp.]
MTEPGRILAVIPARAGSKRLPRKNTASLGGQPMVSWSIRAALDAGLAGRILVTSDDPEVLAIAETWEGVRSLQRPAELATDQATTADVLRHAVTEETKAGRAPDTLVLLQPTSPLRIGEDIANALNQFCQGGGESVVSVSPVEHPLAWCGKVDANGALLGIDLQSAQRSQDYEPDYRLNGAVYVVDVAGFVASGSLFTDRILASIMPRERSVDVDEALDLTICQSLMQER